MKLRAVFENGVFRPIDPVTLPERTTVEVTLPEAPPQERANQDEIFAILRTSYPSGESNVAERHDDHQ